MSVLTARECAELDFLIDQANWQQTYSAGRVCKLGGCKTVLSIYNPSEWCARHEPKPDWHYQGMDFAPCEDCGEIIQVRKDRPGRKCRPCSEASRKKLTEKECPRCGLVKPRSSFRDDPRTATGLQSYCIECDAARKREARLRRAKAAPETVQVVFPHKTYRMEIK